MSTYIKLIWWCVSQWIYVCAMTSVSLYVCAVTSVSLYVCEVTSVSLYVWSDLCFIICLWSDRYFLYMSVQWPVFHYMSGKWPVFHYMSVKWPVFHYMSVQWPVFHCSQHIKNTNLMQYQLIFFWVQACCSKCFPHKVNKLWSLAQSRSANHQPPRNIKLVKKSQKSFMWGLRFSQWYCVLGCGAMQVVKQFLTLQRSEEHLSSNKPKFTPMTQATSSSETCLLTNVHNVISQNPWIFNILYVLNQ